VLDHKGEERAFARVLRLLDTLKLAQGRLRRPQKSSERMRKQARPPFSYLFETNAF
jgi:hypothetical protein